MLNLKHISLPAAWDLQALKQIELKSGVSYEDVVKDIDDALGIASDNLMNSYAGRLTYVTDEAALEYDSGNVKGFERMTERAKGDGRKADGSGHMLPLVPFDYVLSWTYLWLRNARQADIDRQINRLIDNTHNIFENQVYTRLFKMEEETGNYYGLGATGVSVPFCDGGNGSIAYTPIAYPERGGTFLPSHNHYLRLDGITEATANLAVGHIWEHGVDGPFDIIISQADVALWKALPNFVNRPDPEVAYGSDFSLANVEDIYIGGLTTQYGFCRLKANGRIPTGYWSVTKTHGVNNMMNPLAVRTEDGNLGASLVISGVGHYPLQDAIPMIFFGVGTGMVRESTVVVRNSDSGIYVSPTIS